MNGGRQLVFRAADFRFSDSLRRIGRVRIPKDFKLCAQTKETASRARQ